MDNALLMYLKKMNKKLDDDFLSVQTQLNNIKITVDDILLGRNLSEWIADLAASGVESATYKDSSRMQALTESKDACRNITVNQYIFDWSVNNNKVGTFFGSALGTVSGVTWSNLTTSAKVCANANAFRAVANDTITFTVAVTNNTFRPAIFDNRSVTRSIFESSNVAMTIMKNRKTTKKYTSNSCTWKYYKGLKLYAYRLTTKAICCMHENADGKVWVFWGDWDYDSPNIDYDYEYDPWAGRYVDINDLVVKVGAKNDSRGCQDIDPVIVECFDFS